MLINLDKYLLNNDTMKVGLVINDITGLGGAERVVTLAANYFSEVKNCEVEILSVFPKRNNNIGFNLNRAVKVHYLPTLSNTSNKINKSVQLLKNLKAHYKIANYNYIICCSSALTILSRLSIVGLNTSKVISWEHTQHSHLSKKVNLLQRLFYPFISGVVTLTKFDEKIFLKYCKHVKYIPNISTFVKAAPSTLMFKKVIAVGRLNEAKGFDMLIQSFVLVHEKHPDWTLDIFGEGALFQNLSNQIDKEDLGEVVKLKGYEQNILNEYQKASIFALSSRTEGFPCVLVEAMSIGLPSVNFELPGFDEVVINNENGLLIEANNVKLFAEGLINLIENKSLRLKIGENAIESVQKFKGENIVPKWFELFNEIEN